MPSIQEPVFDAPDISVVVPCYNAALWLEPLLESVVAQRDANWELVFVDDGSTDETARVLREICAREPRARAVSIANSGPAHARNVGVQLSNPDSRFLFFLDADDRLKSDALQRMQRYLEAHPRVGLVACQFEEIDERGQFVGVGVRSRWVPGRLLPRTLRANEYATPFVTFFCVTGQGPFALYRRTIWQRTGGWDANLSYAEDADMFCQMALLAPVHYLPVRLYQKRVHRNQAMNSANHDKIQRAHHKFRAKWDNSLLQTPHQSAILENAKRHYRRRHAPLRDLKVAWLLFSEWRRDGQRDAAKFRRVLGLFASAARGFAGWSSPQ